MFFTEIPATNANTLKIQKVNSFNVQGQKSMHLNIDKLTYFRGYVRSEQVLQHVAIRNAQGDIVKKIISSPTQEAEVFWLAEKGNYQLLLSTASIPSIDVEVLLHEIELKQDQYISPATTIISPKLKQLAVQVKQNDKQAEQVFWQQIEMQGSPLVEYTAQDALLTFLYKGPVNNVRILGSPYGGHTQLTQLKGTEVWFHTFTVPSSTRLSYRVAPNAPQLTKDNAQEQRRAVLATTQPDPLNHGEVFAKQDCFFGTASSVTLKDAPTDNWLNKMGNPAGNTEDFLYQGKNDELARKVTIYYPNKTYNIAKDAPLLILFDGDAYLSKTPITTLFDNLIAAKKIPAMRVVFFNQPLPSMRNEELTPNEDFTKLLANEFTPWLCTKLQICPAANNSILAGSSFGGLAATHIAFQHPDKFAKVLSLSGSFWWSHPTSSINKSKTNWLIEQVSNKPKADIQLYLSVGIFETEPKGNSLLTSNRKLYQSLKNLKYKVTLDETASGHDYFNWQHMLAKGLINLYSE